jgi:hypothetical protein
VDDVGECGSVCVMFFYVMSMLFAIVYLMREHVNAADTLSLSFVLLIISASQ